MSGSIVRFFLLLSKPGVTPVAVWFEFSTTVRGEVSSHERGLACRSPFDTSGRTGSRFNLDHRRAGLPHSSDGLVNQLRQLGLADRTDLRGFHLAVLENHQG